MHTPGAQMQGRWKFHYSMIPHEGGWEKAFAEAHRFLRPMRAVRTSRGDRTLPPSGSLVEIEPPQIILSALKLAEDGDAVVARVYNIADRKTRGSLRLHGAHRRVDRVNLNEERPVRLKRKQGYGPLELNLKQNEIATLKFDTEHLSVIRALAEGPLCSPGRTR
jgi:alpha-mannosidase